MFSFWCHNPKFRTSRTGKQLWHVPSQNTCGKTVQTGRKNYRARGVLHVFLRRRILFVRMTTMKRSIPVPVFVVALLISQLSCNAQSPGLPKSIRPSPVPQNYGDPTFPAGSYAPAQPNLRTAPLPTQSNNSLIPSKNSLTKFSPIRTGEAEMPEESFNGFAQVRETPDFGAPGSAGHGFHHFSLPFDKYTQWYRPRAATLTPYQRCAPDAFRPRGYGNLFARPYDGYRMEFEPYVLGDGPSRYGPSYVARMPDARCTHCTHCKRCKGECECQ